MPSVGCLNPQCSSEGQCHTPLTTGSLSLWGVPTLFISSLSGSGAADVQLSRGDGVWLDAFVHLQLHHHQLQLQHAQQAGTHHHHHRRWYVLQEQLIRNTEETGQSQITRDCLCAAKEMNPSVAAISALAVLSILLISLLVLFLLVLRKKHLQITRY